MPRSLTAQETRVLTKRRRGTACRVSVKDSTGTFQDLRAFLGKSWVVGVSYGEDIDDPVTSATIKLWRDRYSISLAPLVETSKANLLTGSYAPLIDAMREVKIEAAMLPEGVAPASGDWREVFRGFIDSASWGGKHASLSLECRDLAAPLAEIVTEKEGRPDTSAYGLDPSGRPMEEVIQDVLDDWATPGGYTIVAFTPTGTGGDPRPIAERSGYNITRFVPAKGQSALDTIRIIANHIGYDVRVRWSDVTNEHRLEIFNPPRTKVVPDITIGPGAIRDIDRLEIDPSTVRNAFRVTYQTDPDDEDTRTHVEDTDAASIVRYRRRWMEVAEAASSGINSATEANQMLAAIKSDIKDPKAEMVVSSDYRFDLVLNDLVRWLPDAKHFTAAQDLACLGLRSRIDPGGAAETVITTRGRPCGQFSSWLFAAAAPGQGTGTRTWPGRAVTPDITANIGSVVISIDASNLIDRDILHWEYHLSDVGPSFTPTFLTRVARGNMTSFTVLGLTPGTTYYAKVVAVRVDGVRSVSSAASAAIPTKLGAGLLEDGSVKNQHVTTDPAQAIVKAKVAVAGTWTEAEIPTLAKSKISTAGTWVEADIPVLSAAKVPEAGSITGQGALATKSTVLNADFGEAIAKTKISTSGTWPVADIPTLTLAKISDAGDLASLDTVAGSHIEDGLLHPFRFLTDVGTTIVFTAAADPALAKVEITAADEVHAYKNGVAVFDNAAGSTNEKRYGWIDTAVSATVIQASDTPPATFDPTTQLMLWAMNADPSVATSVDWLPEWKSEIVAERLVVGGLRVAAAGTSFPTSPAANDRFFRTDRSIEYFYDGTRWLSVQEYSFDLVPHTAFPSGALSSNTVGRDRANAPYAGGATQIYITTWETTFFVATTNDGTHYWNIGLADTSTTAFSSFNTSNLGVDTWVRKVTTYNAVRTVASDLRYMDTHTKVSSPGNLFAQALTVRYRLIG